MGDTLLASEAAACASRSWEIQQLARRLQSCTIRTEAIVAKLGQLQLQDWQSPAGRAYRTTVGVQQSALRKGRDALEEASVTVFRHARTAITAPGRGGS